MTRTITDFIEKDLLLPSQVAELSVDVDLWETGLLSSLQFMRLISFVESEWDISIPSEDMVLEHFQSINTINQYISTRTDA